MSAQKMGQNMKKEKKHFKWGFGKKKKKHQNGKNNDDINKTEVKSDDDIKEYHNGVGHNNNNNNNNMNDENDEIARVVVNYQNILSRLQKICHTNNATHHHMDVERFHKLMHWVDFNESHLSILEKAWYDGSFWPFLSTDEATDQVNKDKKTMIIRLSNTKAGTITVTRSAKLQKRIHNGSGKVRLEDIVKHKRYYPSTTKHGKIILTGSDPEREVTWDGLLAYLKQNECCICLEELKHDSDVLRLTNCGHHFHKKCILSHIHYSDVSAVCPLCRSQISKAEAITEPKIKKYDQFDFKNMNKKSKSSNQLIQSRTNDDDKIQRAFTITTPTTAASSNITFSAMSANVGGFDNNIGSDFDDDYASTKSPAIQQAINNKL